MSRSLVKSPLHSNSPLGRLARAAWPYVTGPLVLVAIWQVAWAFDLVDPRLLPSPAATLTDTMDSILSGDVFADLSPTFLRVFYAFAAAALVGVPLGIVLGANERVYRAVEFVIDFFRSTPATAMFPLFLLLFGLGDFSKIAVASFAALLVIVFNTAYGVMNARRTRLLAARSMGASYVPCAGPTNLYNRCTIAKWPNDGRNCQNGNMGQGNEDAPGMFAAQNNAYSFAQCRDGLSNTFLLGETLPARRIHAMYFNSLGHLATTNIPPNYWKINPLGCPEEYVSGRFGGISHCHLDMAGFNSYHRGGVHVAMADGSVHFVSETIDYRTWVFLGDRADREVAQLP